MMRLRLAPMAASTASSCWRRAPCEQQDGDVSAADEEQQANCAENQVECGADVVLKPVVEMSLPAWCIRCSLAAPSSPGRRVVETTKSSCLLQPWSSSWGLPLHVLFRHDAPPKLSR
jgi:hypothetical protein